MNRLFRGIILSATLGAAVYVAFAAYADWGKVAGTLASFSPLAFVLALGLAATNYLIRFFKWDYYLTRLDVHIPRGRSLCIFLSGFTLTVTPGKMGEVVKSYLLRESDGVPIARTAPVVVAERLTDLLALVVLAGIGALSYRVGLVGVVAALGLVALFLGLLSSERLMTVLLSRLPHKVSELYTSMKVLVRARPLVLATALSVLAWACECAAFYVVLRGFPGAEASLGLCTFIYAAMTIAGALSFLPGGLGVTEAGMTGLLVALAHGVGKPMAVAATVLIRLATLWFAVAVGVAALLLFLRRHQSVLLSPAPPSA